MSETIDTANSVPIDRRRRRGRHHEPYDHGEPLRWLSLVPLAGIFAIAGALIASAYGITPHMLEVELPAPMPEGEMGDLTPNVNRLVLTGENTILWNGTEVSEAELGRILESRRRQGEGAALLFTPQDDVSFGRTVEVLDILRQHGAIDRCFRFSGIARYRQYEDQGSFDELVPYQREDCPKLPPEPQNAINPR